MGELPPTAGVRDAVPNFLGANVPQVEGLLDVFQCFYDPEESKRRVELAKGVLVTLEWFLESALVDPSLHYEIACTRNRLSGRIEEFERSLAIVASLAAMVNRSDRTQTTTR